MTTHDERPPGVRSAEAAATAWREALQHQWVAPASHADFYGLAAEVVDTLYTLADLTELLTRQVGGYGQGRELYDDTRTVDPDARLTEAGEHLRALRTALVSAASEANKFWNAIGHIGVEAAP
ncbi:MAG: hypothetical protein H0X35_02905 [Pseudonocardiales bacterium]|nr:hypothetical protein [Pseudonocardiales bacterium]